MNKCHRVIFKIGFKNVTTYLYDEQMLDLKMLIIAYYSKEF